MKIVEVVKLSNEQAIKLVKRDCSKFLSQSNGKLLTHDTESAFPSYKIKTIIKRRPEAKFEKALNQAFLNNGFSATRLNSLFTVGPVGRKGIGSFGDNSYYIFPIGSFAFTWSPTIIDLNLDIGDSDEGEPTPAVLARIKRFDKSFNNLDPIDAAELLQEKLTNLQFANKFVSTFYRNNDLGKAAMTMTEIMIKANYCYAFPVNEYKF